MRFMTRIGEILYGVAWLIAAPMVALMLYLWATAPGSQAEQYVLLFLAAATLTVGRSLLYLWSGR